MIRTLLTTSALVAFVTAGAFAQGTGTQAPAPGTQPPAASEPVPGFADGMPIFSETPGMEMQSANGYFTAVPGQILARDLIGESVYNNAGDNAEKIGSITDLLLTADGTVKAAIIGVGGFLGLGAKNVALDIALIAAVDRDGERWLFTEATKEEVEQAPAYEGGDEDVAADGNTESDRQTTIMGSQERVDPAAPPNAAERAAPAAPSEQGSADTSVDISGLSADELIGSEVYGAEDDVIGQVSDVILDGEEKVEALIVDVGGFLGVGTKPVALDPAAVEIRKDEDGDLVVHTPYTQSRLEAQQSYSEDSYRTDRDSVILR